MRFILREYQPPARGVLKGFTPFKKIFTLHTVITNNNYYLNSEPFHDQTNDLNTGLVCYSDPNCKFLHSCSVDFMYCSVMFDQMHFFGILARAEVTD